MLEIGDDMFTLRRFINGIFLSTITLVISLWITASAFDKNSYYLAQLLPLFMAIYMLLAWVIYLRQDNVMNEAIPEERDPFGEDSLYTLLWSACLLAFLAAILYWFFQIGSQLPPL
ncbi:MAG: hypothetical protein KGZ53_11560 [Peptococcaceae bacterium]|nr:hypothetical protein [Peptococcaceae bacterium]